MSSKSRLSYFYPDLPEDTVGTKFLEYRIGLILLLSIACSTCSLLYAEQGGYELKVFSVFSSLYFLRASSYAFFLPYAFIKNFEPNFFFLILIVFNFYSL